MSFKIFVKKRGGYNLISLKDWEQYSANQKLDLMINQAVEFIDENGNSIAPYEALSTLKK